MPRRDRSDAMAFVLLILVFAALWAAILMLKTGLKPPFLT
jgi:hypothetical protein